MKYRACVGICAIRCMDGSSTSLRCRHCNGVWSGSTLLIGTMYSYDVFAATPCCEARLQCKQCHQSVIDHTSPTGSSLNHTLAMAPPLKYYSEYSRRVKCQRCGAEDHHFVKSLAEMYDVSPLVSQHSAALPRVWCERDVDRLDDDNGLSIERWLSQGGHLFLMVLELYFA